MASFDAWRFEPLPPDRFPLGEGPFRVRGLAYIGALAYVDYRLEGGRARFLEALGKSDPYAAYYDRIFVLTADYDASPLVRLYRIISELKGKPIAQFIETRSRWSANNDTHGIWKPMLRASSPEMMAERLPFAFNRYFEPARARGLEVSTGSFACEFTGVPAPMDGLYAASTLGFVTAALAIAGAKNVKLDWKRPSPTGEAHGVPTERLEFLATWSAPVTP